jgi:hypothetical protein
MLTRYAKRTLLVVGLVAGGLVATSDLAFADQPEGPATGPQGQFLCPIVGDGVDTADDHNGDNGVSNIGPLPGSGGASLLPGNNQAGPHANTSALNPEGPGTSPGPGDGNSDWSPIWPGTVFE